MSFASNRSPTRLPTVTRGRISIGGGLKRGGFSMYGSTPQTRSVNSDGPAWYEDIQDELNVEYHHARDFHDKMIAKQEELNLRRAIRSKSGKHEDTEGMQIEQEKILRHVRHEQQQSHKRDADHAEAMVHLKHLWYCILFILAVSTPLGWVIVAWLFYKLTRGD